MSSHTTVPLDAPTREKLQAFVDRLGHKAAVDQLGIHQYTLWRVLAGQPCREGTIELVRTRFAKAIKRLERAAS